VPLTDGAQALGSQNAVTRAAQSRAGPSGEIGQRHIGNRRSRTPIARSINGAPQVASTPVANLWMAQHETGNVGGDSQASRGGTLKIAGCTCRAAQDSTTQQHIVRLPQSEIRHVEGGAEAARTRIPVEGRRRLEYSPAQLAVLRVAKKEVRHGKIEDAAPRICASREANGATQVAAAQQAISRLAEDEIGGVKACLEAVCPGGC
jgi:hypothetical protein